MVIRTYPLKVEESRWERIKNSIPSDKSLNEALIERLDSPLFERRTDNGGRVTLGVDHAETEVVVALIESDGELVRLEDE